MQLCLTVLKRCLYMYGTACGVHDWESKFPDVSEFVSCDALVTFRLMSSTIIMSFWSFLSAHLKKVLIFSFLSIAFFCKLLMAMC